MVGPLTGLAHRSFRANNCAGRTACGSDALIIIVADKSARAKSASRCAAAIFHAVVVLDTLVIGATERDVECAAFVVGLTGFAGTEVAHAHVSVFCAAIGLDMKTVPAIDLLPG